MQESADDVVILDGARTPVGKYNGALAALSAVELGAQAIRHALATEHGWGEEQFGCRERIWSQESNWTTTAQNPSSGALWHPAGPARHEDGQRWPGLADQPRDPDRVGAGLH